MRLSLKCARIARSVIEIHLGHQHPRLQIRYKLGLADINRFVGELADAAEIIESTVAYPVVLSDPSDDKILYTAVNGRADVLCTGNTTDFGRPNVIQFCAEHGIRILTDIEVLRELASK